MHDQKWWETKKFSKVVNKDQNRGTNIPFKPYLFLPLRSALLLFAVAIIFSRIM
jgi:hypothetical protein